MQLMYLVNSCIVLEYLTYRLHTLDAYTDFDFASSLFDRRFTTGYCIFLAGNTLLLRGDEGFSAIAIAIAGAGPPFASEGPALAITREKFRACHTAEGWRFSRRRTLASANKKSRNREITKSK